MPGEFDLIAKYFTRPAPGAVLGVGDDCALIAPSAGMELAITTDMLIAGQAQRSQRFNIDWIFSVFSVSLWLIKIEALQATRV